MKALELTFRYNKDCLARSWETLSQPNGEVIFRAHDLSDCPEDAILGRDLFGAYDFLEALELGMSLAQQGYTTITIIEKPCDNEDEDEEEEEETGE